MDGPGLPGRSLDEAACFERQDHLMHGGRRDSKVLPHFSLRRRTSVDLAVVINESQILTLFVRVSFLHGHRSNKPKLGPPFKRYSLREVSTDRGGVRGSGESSSRAGAPARR